MLRDFLSALIFTWKRKRTERANRLYRKERPSKLNTPKHKQLMKELGL